jgi:hypothetical protein
MFPSGAVDVLQACHCLLKCNPAQLLTTLHNTAGQEHEKSPGTGQGGDGGGVPDARCQAQKGGAAATIGVEGLRVSVCLWNLPWHSR